MSDRPAVRARNHIVSSPWMLTPEMMQTLIAIADRENLSPQAVAAEIGRPLDNAHAVEVRNGVAIIPVDGVISRYMSIFSAISGGVSIETLATDLRAATDNPAITAILLAIDSPGGEANGVGEFAAMVRAANDRKPVVAYVGGMAASAGYYIASAAGEIVVAADAIVGNIGVIMGVPDPDKRASRTIDFVSSQSPHKRPDPRTEGGKARLQGMVDALAAVFIGAVADYRGMTPDAVEALGGDVLIGQTAIDAGLADRLGSFEGVVAELQQRAREPRRIGIAGRIAAQKDGGSMPDEQKQGRMERFMGWLAGEGDDSAFAAANIAASGTPPPVAARSIPAREPDPEKEELRAELARLRNERVASARASIGTRAEAFAEAEIVASRALPAEREALVAMYTDAATDDLDHPRAEGQPSRVDRLTERQAARPAHSLTAELVPVKPGADGTLSLVPNVATTQAEGAAAPLTADRWREQRAFTTSGRAFLEARGIPVSGPLTAEHRTKIGELAAAQRITIAG